MTSISFSAYFIELIIYLTFNDVFRYCENYFIWGELLLFNFLSIFISCIIAIYVQWQKQLNFKLKSYQLHLPAIYWILFIINMYILAVIEENWNVCLYILKIYKPNSSKNYFLQISVTDFISLPFHENFMASFEHSLKQSPQAMQSALLITNPFSVLLIAW